MDGEGKVWWRRMPMARAGMKTRKRRSMGEGKLFKWKKVRARKRLERRPVRKLKKIRFMCASHQMGGFSH
jgi:hypothetical protein